MHMSDPNLKLIKSFLLLNLHLMRSLLKQMLIHVIDT